MINFWVKVRIGIIFIIMAFFTIVVRAESISSNNITIQYEQMADGGIKVINVWNKSDNRITLKIDETTVTINSNSSAHPNKYAKKSVSFDYSTGGGAQLWIFDESKKTQASTIESAASVNHREEVVSSPTPIKVSYVDKMNQDSFFGQDAVNAYTQKINSLCNRLKESKNPEQFIIDYDLKEVLDQSRQEIELKKSEIPLFAQELVSSSNINSSNQSSTLNLIIETLNNRLKSREEAYTKLNDLVLAIEADNDKDSNNEENILNYAIVGMGVLLILTLTIVLIRKNKKKSLSNKEGASVHASQESSADNPAIVVRRKTTSILKKQCIDDVINNPAYLLINASEFSHNSAIGKIYIKNTCIKEVYNLYAEDLRNSANPNEDGCMVLGRWVYNDSSQTYDISLEEVVLPGDDAVFKEYELNFGGKIKLRIADRLRKLRRDTNLQYDLVCWIHSHPGLGVFFSNSDDNVQTQLKHTQHPNFLIAFVVDILTSDQEMGIFTFRKDGTMNSKGDIVKMYSLEDLYKWALQSERDSFSAENYFNLLKSAKLKIPSCKGIELNNNSIIDITQIVIEAETGVVGWAVGTTIDSNDSREYVVSGIIRDSKKPTTGIIGCLINVSYMSLPTIQRLLTLEARNLSFALVYSSKQMTITTIPIINGELLTDEQFYGDVTIEDLKIWTRRKR